MGVILPLLIVVPLAGAVAVLAIGSDRLSAVRRVALASTTITLLLTVILAATFPSAGNGSSAADANGQRSPIVPRVEWRTSGGTIPVWLSIGPARLLFHLGIDGISIGLILLTALLHCSAVLGSWRSVTEGAAVFYSMLLLLEAGLVGVFSALDLVLFYIFFEFTLIPLFFLIGIWGGAQRRYAARKFLIYTLAGSLISLVGIVGLMLILYEREPAGLTFSIPALAQQLARQPISVDLQRLIFVALFVGFAIKVPLVPFHTWLPLAHVEAPTAGSVILAGVLLKLGTYGFLRLALPLLPSAAAEIGSPLILGLAVAGILYGALCALAQRDVKRLVAYSSISHMGLCMLGMFALNVEGISGSLLQMINHGLITGALFLVVGMVYDRYHTREIDKLGGIASRLPVWAVLAVFFTLASVGLPGLNGFVGEFLCLAGAFQDRPFLTALAAVGMILGAWYFLKMVQRVVFGQPGPAVRETRGIDDLDHREVWALAPLAALCLFLGLYPKPVLDWMRPDIEAIARLYQTSTVEARTPRFLDSVGKGESDS